MSQAVSARRSLIHMPSELTRFLFADLSPEEITNSLQLNKLKDKLWYVVPSIATDGTGIFEGLVSHVLIYCLSIYVWSDDILTKFFLHLDLAIQQCQESASEVIIVKAVDMFQRYGRETRSRSGLLYNVLTTLVAPFLFVSCSLL